MTRPILLVALGITLAFASHAAAQTSVTTCGQEVTGAATLDADLDCTGLDGGAVTIHGGSLAMNGHTITGGRFGIFCDAKCTILGPGTVTGATFAGLQIFGTSVRVTGVDITNCALFGMQVWKAAVVEGPATISGNGDGIRAGNVARITNVTITGNYFAVEVANNVSSGSVTVKGSTITANRTGLFVQRKVVVTDSTIAGNEQYGIEVGGCGNGNRPGRAMVKHSTVTGNGTDSECGSTIACADIASCPVPPKLRAGSTCDHSYVLGSGIPGNNWGVCALD